MNTATVRLARKEDFPDLESLERRIWERGNGMAPLNSKHFETWIKIYPDGFIVSEQNKKITGFGFAEIVEIDNLYDDPRLTCFDSITDGGYCRKTHTAKGGYHFGVTLCSDTIGSGKALFQYAKEYLDSTGIPFLTPCRLPTFGHYYDCLLNTGTNLSEEQAAADFVDKSRRVVGGEKIENFKADPNLAFHLKPGWLKVVRLLPKNFLQDPKSMGYSVLLKQEI